jgi:hypothetical protein
MCCLVEKALPQKSRRAYSGGFFQTYNPKRFQKKAKEYISNTTPSIVHGKFVEVGEYVVIGNKRAVLIGAAPEAADSIDLAREFQSLTSEWRKDTGFHSSLAKKVMHPAYQRIMAIGKPALPFILRDLRETSDHWFYALRYIVGKDIGSEANASTTEEATRAWLEWGYRHNHI